MIPSHVQVKLSVLADVTGWGYSTLHKNRKEFAEFKRGAWVASFNDYQEWLNGEKGKRRGDNQNDADREVQSGNEHPGSMDQRPNSRKESRRAQSPAKQATKTQFAWVTDNGVELGVEVHNRHGSK